MKISFKTLKGQTFSLEVDDPTTVAELKAKLEESNSSLPANRLKLIHVGKVLKDEEVATAIPNISSGFVVCMVSKETKPSEPTQTSAPAAEPAPTTASAPAAASAPAPVAAATPAPAPVAVATPAPAPDSTVPPAAPPATQEVNEQSLSTLLAFGFPEDQVRAALQHSGGDPDLAYYYLENGLPLNMPTVTSAAPRAPKPLDALRRHPQLDMLKQLVQNDPNALQQVLAIIGQQDPNLLNEIHANNEEFISLMNEPIGTVSGLEDDSMDLGDDNMISENGLQLIQSLLQETPEQRAIIAQSMGLTPQQLEEFIVMAQSLPPGALQNAANQAQSHSHAQGPQNVLQITEEENNAIMRLVDLGFTKQQAAQAYFSCDKNEELAANFLFDGGFNDDEDA